MEALVRDKGADLVLVTTLGTVLGCIVDLAPFGGSSAAGISAGYLLTIME
ncbi:hypothetical protein HaLaN_08991 [Haematococcus lacustris]|uniref:Uncharacterized protein n=1 Tax=Haematococcus lacustris TaxID=44745 RepID=A0A699YTK9_HAELA|nr:hypothetical protein HaLaN_08991 [Haematococcus lacustris]